MVLSYSMWITLALAILMYGSSYALIILQLQRYIPTRQSYLTTSITVGLLCHALLLFPNLIQHQYMYFTPVNSLSLTTWLMLTYSLIFSIYRPVWVLHLLAIPLATIGLVAGATIHQPYVPSIMPSGLVLVHIVFSIAAYCLLFMASVQSALLFWQNKQLKHPSRYANWLEHLPSLVEMEKLLFDMIIIGFFLLTVALSVGFVGVGNIFAQHLAHKTFFSILAWLFYAGLIVGRLRFGLRGKYAIRYTIIGFMCLFIGFWGTKVILSLLL